MTTKPGRVRSEKIAMFRMLAFIVIPFMNLLGKYSYQGLENVPKSGAVVISPNHDSEIEPLVRGISVWKAGRAPRYMAKASLFDVPVLGWVLRKTRQIPVHRSNRRGSDPLAAARQLATEGLAVVIYPEGSLTREPDLWPMRGKAGAVRMALEADVPLIPAAHWGTQRIMPRYGKLSLFPRKRVTVRFGEPVDLSAYRGKPLDNALLTRATDELMARIAGELSVLRGEPAPAERWDPAVHGQAETGRIE
ncbi:MAG: 1-acyl-sn-glycerol-3-phosphate acyltransferase [Cryobacterium sp.]|nr:1-acyl-sn-glycerol-3-phosphate acyltransferase [Cryobacterium sp.]